MHIYEQHHLLHPGSILFSSFQWRHLTVIGTILSLGYKVLKSIYILTFNVKESKINYDR